MSASRPSAQRPRAIRARTLVVGGGPLVRELSSALRKHLPAVSDCESLYDAVAEVGMSSAREPVSAVVVSADCEDFALREVVEAFRLVDPAVPLILAVRRGQEDLVAAAIAEDFEHSVVLPAASDELLAVLHEVGLVDHRREPSRDAVRESPSDFARELRAPAREAEQIQSAPQSPRQTPPTSAPSPVAPADAPRGAIERNVVELAIEDAIAGASRGRGHAQSTHASHGAPASHASHASHGAHASPASHASHASHTSHASHASHASPAPQTANPSQNSAAPSATPPPTDAAPPRRRTAFTMPSPRPSPPRDAPPGDVDLVRAVLENADLQGTALRVLRHHLGSTDVRFVAAPRPGEEDAIRLERRGLREAPVRVGDRVHGALLSATLDEATLAAWAAWLSHWIELDESHRELRRFAWTDELTGAGNRRAFDTVLRDAMSLALSERRTISVMYLDIDDFKRYNDEYGHHAGDEVLRETAELLRACVRAGDHVFRIGGDEFVVVFCDASGPRKGGGSPPESVEAIARRFQRAIGEMSLPQLGSAGPGTVTVSAGVAVFPWEGHDAETLVHRADQRALESKRNGKNHITFGPGAAAADDAM